MIRGSRPDRLIYDADTSCIEIHYPDIVLKLKGCARRDGAFEYTRKDIFDVGDGEMFNVAGVHDVSFVNRCSKTLTPKRPKHLRGCSMSNNMVELRPWLKRGCSACAYGDRRGTMGHYFQQSSMVAAPLT